MMTRHRWIFGFAALLMALMVLGQPTMAMAQSAPAAPAASPANDNPEQMDCTNFEERKEEVFGGSTDDGEGGLLSEIYRYIKDIVGSSTEKLFKTFTDSTAYRSAVAGALTLVVAFYGIGFTIGVVQASFGQVLIRLFKIGIIATLISPSGWQFFSDYMVKFFMDGTDELVTGVVAIGTGTAPPPDATPFYQFDKLAEFIIEPQTLVAIMGSLFAGGPYGFAVGGIMIMAFWGFVKLLIGALQTYAIAFVARSLLLGLAPVFFVFLLFDKTKNLFMSWVNALLNTALQPILLFTFLAFFMVLIETASQEMLSTEFCWSTYRNVNGTPGQAAMWRPTDEDGNPIVSEMSWGGALECLFSSEKGNCKEFPMNIVDILTFLLLVFLAQRFTGVIDRIAGELSNALIILDAGGKMDQFLEQQGRNAGQAVSGTVGQVTGALNPRPPG